MMFDEIKVIKLCEKYNINTIYLFGSYYDGTFTPGSDIDIAYLIYPGNHYCDHYNMYSDFKEIFKQEVDLVNIRKAKTTFAFHIIKYSKMIYDKNEEVRTDFEDVIIMKYLDFSVYNDVMNKEMASNFTGDAG